MKPLAVGLNLAYLTRRSGGAGRYARELIPALLTVEPATRLTAFVSKEFPPELRDEAWAAEVDWVEAPFEVSGGPRSNLGGLVAWQWLAIPAYARRRRLDVVHGLANVAPLAAPGAARVVTLLDLIWLHHPGDMERLATLGMKLTALPSARLADRVLAISRAARDDIVRTLRLPRDRIDVTYLGIRAEPTAPATPEAELRERLALGDAPVVLCVAQKRPHKNLHTLLRAVAALGAEQAPALVIPGQPTPYEQELRALAGELGATERLHLPDWLSDEDLEGLYELASCFVLPSLEEGFGLPVLEAMRRGVPVACSNLSSLPEVAGDAALLFDPHDVHDVAAAVARLLGDPELASDLAERGRARCERFSWESTARGTLDSYRRAISGPRRLVPRRRAA